MSENRLYSLTLAMGSDANWEDTIPDPAIPQNRSELVIQAQGEMKGCLSYGVAFKHIFK